MRELPISTAMAGVNVRLRTDAVREIEGVGSLADGCGSPLVAPTLAMAIP